MPEENPTTSTSEPGSGDAGASNPGEGAEGGAGGTAAAEQFAAEREALRTEARQRQSEADKARAERDRALAELEKIKAGSSGGETPPPTPGLTAEQVQEQVRQAMRQEAVRARELSSAETTAREQYPNADPSVLDASLYETAEDFLAAAKASHDRIASHVDARLEAAEKELREKYAAKYGELPAPPDSTSDPGATGDPTVAQLSAMSLDQLDELEKRAPGTIDRVIRSADQMS